MVGRGDVVVDGAAVRHVAHAADLAAACDGAVCIERRRGKLPGNCLIVDGNSRVDNAAVDRIAAARLQRMFLAVICARNAFVDENRQPRRLDGEGGFFKSNLIIFSRNASRGNIIGIDLGSRRITAIIIERTAQYAVFGGIITIAAVAIGFDQPIVRHCKLRLDLFGIRPINNIRYIDRLDRQLSLRNGVRLRRKVFKRIVAAFCARREGIAAGIGKRIAARSQRKAEEGVRRRRHIAAVYIAIRIMARVDVIVRACAVGISRTLICRRKPAPFNVLFRQRIGRDGEGVGNFIHDRRIVVAGRRADIDDQTICTRRARHFCGNNGKQITCIVGIVNYCINIYPLTVFSLPLVSIGDSRAVVFNDALQDLRIAGKGGNARRARAVRPTGDRSDRDLIRRAGDLIPNKQPIAGNNVLRLFCLLPDKIVAVFQIDRDVIGAIIVGSRCAHRCTRRARRITCNGVQILIRGRHARIARIQIDDVCRGLFISVVFQLPLADIDAHLCLTDRPNELFCVRAAARPNEVFRIGKFKGESIGARFGGEETAALLPVCLRAVTAFRNAASGRGNGHVERRSALQSRTKAVIVIPFPCLLRADKLTVIAVYRRFCQFIRQRNGEGIDRPCADLFGALRRCKVVHRAALFIVALPGDGGGIAAGVRALVAADYGEIFVVCKVDLIAVHRQHDVNRRTRVSILGIGSQRHRHAFLRDGEIKRCLTAKVVIRLGDRRVHRIFAGVCRLHAAAVSRMIPAGVGIGDAAFPDVAGHVRLLFFAVIHPSGITALPVDGHGRRNRRAGDDELFRRSGRALVVVCFFDDIDDMVCARLGGWYSRLSFRFIGYAAVGGTVVGIVAGPRRDRCAADGNARHAARRICRAVIRPALNGRRAGDDRLPLCDRKGARIRRLVDICVARIGDGICILADIPTERIRRHGKGCAVIPIGDSSCTPIAEAVRIFCKFAARDLRRVDRPAVRPAEGIHARDLVICLDDIPRQRFIGGVVFSGCRGQRFRSPAGVVFIRERKRHRIVAGSRRLRRSGSGITAPRNRCIGLRRIIDGDLSPRIRIVDDAELLVLLLIVLILQLRQRHRLAGDGELFLLKIFVRAGICKRHVGVVRHARHFHIHLVAAGKGRNVCTGRRLTPLRISIRIRLLRAAVGRARKGDFDGRTLGRDKRHVGVIIYARDQFDICGQVCTTAIRPAAGKFKCRAHQLCLLNDDGVGDRPGSGVHARPAVTSALQGEGNGIGPHVCQCDGIGLCSDDLAAVKAVVARLGHLRDLGNRRIDIGK